MNEFPFTLAAALFAAVAFAMQAFFSLSDVAAEWRLIQSADAALDELLDEVPPWRLVRRFQVRREAWRDALNAGERRVFVRVHGQMVGWMIGFLAAVLGAGAAAGLVGALLGAGVVVLVFAVLDRLLPLRLA
jgi:hypothetical protein